MIVPVWPLTLLFICLLVVGLLMTLILFKFDYIKLVNSSLFIKIVFWAPIYFLFLVYLYLNNLLKGIFIGILLAMAAREAFAKHKNRSLSTYYFIIFAIAFSHFFFYGISFPNNCVMWLITIGLASVLSDVTAFFFGKFFGNHHLPVKLNNNKSWEGVLGQLIGALFGVLLIKIYIFRQLPLWIFLPIGIGSAAGDLANSYIKRRQNIKDWSDAIPGHGGFLDRFSSLAGSGLLTFYMIKLLGL